MSYGNWLVTAHLASPLCGDPPHLDAIVEGRMSHVQQTARRIRRQDACPPIGAIHWPALRGEFGGVDKLPRCSDPILPPHGEAVEHVAKRLAVEHADLLAPDRRLVVAVGNSWTKSYRLPKVVRPVDRVCWFVGGGRRRNLKTILRRVQSIGHKRSDGYGRVSSWTIDEVEHDWSWFAEIGGRRILMRTLPCDETELEGVEGWRRWFGGVAPPYWHPDRACDIAIPC